MQGVSVFLTQKPVSRPKMLGPDLILVNISAAVTIKEHKLDERLHAPGLVEALIRMAQPSMRRLQHAQSRITPNSSNYGEFALSWLSAPSEVASESETRRGAEN